MDLHVGKLNVPKINVSDKKRKKEKTTFGTIRSSDPSEYWSVTTVISVQLSLSFMISIYLYRKGWSVTNVFNTKRDVIDRTSTRWLGRCLTFTRKHEILLKLKYINPKM